MTTDEALALVEKLLDKAGVKCGCEPDMMFAEVVWKCSVCKDMEAIEAAITALVQERDEAVRERGALVGVALEFVLAFKHGSHTEWADALERLRDVVQPNRHNKPDAFLVKMDREL